MRITYRTLGKLIELMNEAQKDCDVTCEIFDGQDVECFAAELRVCGDNHDSLEDGHPVLFVGNLEDVRRSDVDGIAEDIGLN